MQPMHLVQFWKCEWIPVEDRGSDEAWQERKENAEKKCSEAKAIRWCKEHTRCSANGREKLWQKYHREKQALGSHEGAGAEQQAEEKGVEVGQGAGGFAIEKRS